MTDKFWIGGQRMEIFKLWLASKIMIFSYRATCNDMYWANLAKTTLNSLDNTYLNDNYLTNIFYGMFINELLDAATK